MHTTQYMTPTATEIVQFPFPEAPAFLEDFALPWRSVAAEDVCDLLAATGALSISDIAGGLDVPAGEVLRFVRSLAGAGDLREDEFGRYRLTGGCLGRAS